MIKDYTVHYTDSVLVRAASAQEACDAFRDEYDITPTHAEADYPMDEEEFVVLGVCIACDTLVGEDTGHFTADGEVHCDDCVDKINDPDWQ